MRALLLSLILTLIGCAALADTADDFVFRIDNEETATLVKYQGTDADVTVPGWFHERKVTVLGSGAFEGNHYISNVKVPSHIEVFGSRLFADSTMKTMSAYDAAEPSAEEKLASHTWDDGVVTTQPTATTEGVMTYTCTFDGCGKTKTEAIPAGEGSGGIPGDVNGDACVDLVDLMLMLRYVNGWDVEVDLEAADVNNDTYVDLVDLMLVLRYVNGWDVELV